ncbi:MAG: hypothetical protein Q9Q40_08230 [Acidobacteriota bacterium]|nr:hypothetical protein [Acidobacteriota bacterium]
MSGDTRGAPPARALAIALVAAATLIFEITATRILSVVVWYHFAFLAISLAMVGLGAPGVWLALRRPGPRILPAALGLAAVTLPGSVVVIFKLAPMLAQAPGGGGGKNLLPTSGLALVVMALLLPLLAIGTVICLILMDTPRERLGAIYGADLAGAALGALAVVPLMDILPTPLVTAGSGLLPLLAAAALYPTRRTRLVTSVAALTLAGLLAWQTPFTLRYSKKYLEGGRLLWERWTPTARLTVFDGVFFHEDPASAFGWGMGHRWQPRPIDQLWLEQDGSAGTVITRLDGSPDALDHLLYDVTTAGYQVFTPDKVCIIGAGGGRDILAGKAAGATRIDAVELNRGIVEAVDQVFGDFSGGVYRLPGVRAIVSEGRSFLAHTTERYDMVQVALIDSWAATAAGAYALSENYLYTVEAFELYLSRLADGGVLSISRWMKGRRRLEAVRLVLLARKALERRGADNPLAHMAVLQAGSVANLLVSAKPLDSRRLAAIDAVGRRRGFARLWPVPPGAKPSLIATVLEEGTGGLERYGIDLSPPTDDRPFFFQMVSVLGPVDRKVIEQHSVNEQSILVLRRVLLIVALFTALLFFAPFFGRIPGGTGFWRGSFYYAGLGLGFMLLETSWLQRFVLYLSHPSYAASVVLACLLLGAGAGAGLSSRLSDRTLRRLVPAALLFVTALHFVMPPLLRATLALGFAPRLLISAALLIPAGLALGAWFPAGLRRFGRQHTPWFWAVNGAFSVLSGALSLALAMEGGLTLAGGVGLACYLVLFLL